ncbi:MAG: hypothetical protein KJ626_03385 [Verrucomicrobia bacterium]|nr:hypothetical protein [Verrucomicrobiota bacterium]
MLCLMLLPAFASTVCLADLVEVYRETWDSDAAGWADRDSGKMSSVWSASTGQGAGSLQGSFSSQTVAFPEIDAFRLGASGSGGALTGNYWAHGTPAAWTFDFLAADTPPSSLLLRFTGAGNSFFRAVDTVGVTVGGWSEVNVPLSSVEEWNSTDGVAFSNALGAVETVDIQIARSGSGAQSYYIDNFSLLVSVVPEPGALSLILCGALLCGWSQRKARS